MLSLITHRFFVGCVVVCLVRYALRPLARGVSLRVASASNDSLTGVRNLFFEVFVQDFLGLVDYFRYVLV